MNVSPASRDRRLLSTTCALALALLAATLAPACASSDGAGAAADAGAAGTSVSDSWSDAGSAAWAGACDATEAELYGDPGPIAAKASGTVLRCKDDGVVRAAAMDASLRAIRTTTTLDDGTSFTDTYQGRAPVSDAHVYRVLYRTTRAGGTPGFAVATMYLPTKPLAEKLPLVLVARGSRGQAPLCAPSRHRAGPIDDADNRDGNYVHDDYLALVYPLVGKGLAVIATDNAGYSDFAHGTATNLPSGYAQVDDVARSLLDSAYPLKTALGARSLDKLVLVGLSQGGHTVLGSLQMANEFPLPGPIVAAATYAPLWYTQRSMGITLSPLSVQIAGIVLNKSAGVPVSIWYHYTHAELLDGPGKGLELFKPAKRAAVKEFVEDLCWSKTYPGLTATLGAGEQGAAADFFSDEMVTALAGADLVFGRDCAGSGAPALCEKWLARYQADHPVHTGKALEVPLLLAYGMRDTTIPKARFACAVEKLGQGRSAAQQGKLAYCVNDNVGHGGSVLAESDYVNDWLAAKALGLPDPEPTATQCSQRAWNAAIPCDSLLPND